VLAVREICLFFADYCAQIHIKCKNKTSEVKRRGWGQIFHWFLLHFLLPFSFLHNFALHLIRKCKWHKLEKVFKSKRILKLYMLFISVIELLLFTISRSHWLGSWVKFVQIASFKKLVCLCYIKQNNLTFLGRACTPSLSKSPKILYKRDIVRYNVL